MSLLLAVASNVAATVAATPTPSPQVVKEVVTNNLVPQVPGNVLSLFNLLGLVAAGALTSVVHLALERGKLPSNVNRLLFTVYSTVAGVIVLALGHQVHWDPAAVVTGLTAFFAFLGSTQGQKMLMDFASKLINSTKVDDAGVTVPDLATEELPQDAPA